MPNPPYVPGRQPPHFDVRAGNPLYPQPSMSPPPWNPGGLNPAVATARGVDLWTDHVTVDFQSNGTDYVWTYLTPVFDLRPGATLANAASANAVPINHEAALGQSVYLMLQLFSASGTLAPAALPTMRAAYWEDGNILSSMPMRRLTQVIDVTDLLNAGGTTTEVIINGNVTTPGPCSVFQFTPVAPGLHFWRLGFQLTIPGLGLPAGVDFILEGSLH